MTAPEPITLDAEHRVLGTLLTFYDPALTQKAHGTGLKPADFYYRQHEVIYRAILALDTAGEWVDVLTVTRFLTGHRHAGSGLSFLEEAGGAARVEFVACFADANAFVTCARIVAEDARFRRWMYAMYEGLEALRSRDEKRFWRAMSDVKQDVLPTALRVIDGEGEAAA